MGSSEIKNLEYRQGFVFIAKCEPNGTKETIEIHEKRSQNLNDEVSIT